MLFYSADGEDAGRVSISLTSPPTYHLLYCGMSSTPFTNAPQSKNENILIWRIILTKILDDKDSSAFIAIHCNDTEILNFEMSDDTCNDDRWKTFWHRNVKEISFSSHDTASRFYRRSGSKNTLAIINHTTG